MRLLWLLIFISLSMETNAQYRREIKYEQLKFIRFGSQNDLYQRKNQSDKYFSVGTTIELRHPVFNNIVTQNLLLGLKNSVANEYGVEIEQLGFTPTKIGLPAINPADRPYAGLLYANFYRISSNLKRGLRIRSSLKIGVMGPASGMEQLQKFVHRVIGDTEPVGWETQIGNSLMLDYTFKITQELPINLSYLEVNAAADAELGSIFNLLGVGMEFKLGLLNNFDLHSNPHSRVANLNMLSRTERKFQLYAFLQPRVSYVIYDGTVSGGLIPLQESPHTLARSVSESVLLFLSYGLTAQYKNFMFRYRRVLRSDRFIEGDGFFQGDQFSWGEVDFVFLF